MPASSSRIKKLFFHILNPSIDCDSLVSSFSSIMVKLFNFTIPLFYNSFPKSMVVKKSHKLDYIAPNFLLFIERANTRRLKEVEK